MKLSDLIGPNFESLDGPSNGCGIFARGHQLMNVMKVGTQAPVAFTLLRQIPRTTRGLSCPTSILQSEKKKKLNLKKLNGRIIFAIGHQLTTSGLEFKL
jgi:hypothetical protein